MAQTYPYSKLNPVYYIAGQFDGSQQPRYVKAPFDVVTINGNLFIQPSPDRFGPQGVGQSAASDAEQAKLARQPGGLYTDINPVVVGEHEMGDGADGWKGMHKIGWV